MPILLLMLPDEGDEFKLGETGGVAGLEILGATFGSGWVLGVGSSAVDDWVLLGIVFIVLGARLFIAGMPEGGILVPIGGWLF